MKKLGVGVLGVGEMGKRHAENLRRLVPEARLVAIADASAERARLVAEELQIENWYSSLEAMLERKDLDAVLIATPDKFHAAHFALNALPQPLPNRPQLHANISNSPPHFRRAESASRRISRPAPPPPNPNTHFSPASGKTPENQCCPAQSP